VIRRGGIYPTTEENINKTKKNSASRDEHNDAIDTLFLASSPLLHPFPSPPLALAPLVFQIKFAVDLVVFYLVVFEGIKKANERESRKRERKRERMVRFSG